MRVFLGWSGPVSKHIASSLHDWLSRVDPKLNPWISENDIESGRQWRKEIDSVLEHRRTGAGIICLAPDNINSQWIHFEAGYLTGCRKRVIPYAWGFDSAKEITGPLSALQVVTADRSRTLKLMKDLCRLHGGKDDALDAVAQAFGREWKALRGQLSAKRIDKIRAANHQVDPVALKIEGNPVVRALRRDMMKRAWNRAIYTDKDGNSITNVSDFDEHGLPHPVDKEGRLLIEDDEPDSDL